MPKCNKCHEEIEWVETPKGKNVPINPEPVEPTEQDKDQWLCRDEGKFWSKAGKAKRDHTWYIPHFATCLERD